MTHGSWSMVGLLALMVSCGGAPTPPAPDTPAPPDTPAADTPAVEAPASDEGPQAWADDLSHDDKGAFMKSHVMPKMGDVFREADAERYASFNCQTCHGTAWKDQPRDALPKLTMKDGKFDVPPEKAPIVEFMMKRVVPEMATLFGKPPYDPATNQGFGCAGCHVVEM